MLALNLGDVILATSTVRVRQGKGSKDRVVFLGDLSKRYLVKYLDLRETLEPDGPLWVTNQGQRLRYHGLRSMVIRRAKKAGVPAPRLHDFRRAFALSSLRGGCDLISLQRLMGHADLTILKRYLAQTEADLRAAHARAGPVDNLGIGNI